ncbi:hypothetical protein J437_LFUL010447 [Ladona fulva]|uniref:Uncharacterized protein n=1 Tax=Ladona fulva TaxID=123851 RepID=A0A8K0K9Y0_LADFU|nr:hypothetical protein J437_LFUL010447 [Ladona fulva]
MKTIEGKIVVLGAQGVGKTSMVVRYIGKMFSHHISPTIGASFFTCKINIDDTRVKLQSNTLFPINCKIELQRNVEEPMVLCVVGNKVDLASQRKVPRDEAYQYASSIGGLYFEASALQDQGIEDIFLSVAMGLVKLTEDPSQRTSIKVYEGKPGNQAVNDQREEDSSLPHVLGGPSIARADAERTVWCC